MYSFVFSPQVDVLTLIILGTLILAVRKHVTNTLVVETTRLFFNELMIFFFLPLEISLSRFVSATLSVLL